MKHTIENIPNMPTTEILAAFNELTGSNVKRFSTRKAGVDRLTKAIIEASDKVGGDEQERLLQEKQEEPKAKVVKEPKAKTTRVTVIDLKRQDTIKGHRPETKRAIIINLLGSRNGATVEECMAATGWDRKTCMEGIRLLNTYLGYGLKSDEAGHIHLVK